ncbi:amino acid/amide ABC transporter ATP-binding protein 1 (HAAT family) [Roseiarcus fermentans]|uniref:Amino acid/amide ABC transporter ATP-binding protein 1 (HAAT family) n=1 Tax=Roseiarcus fermentans TaxID=1473586 RepID=A0A366FBM6_9HYPH|nr:ABC transporter ATP-binding protein [Roseiarcus fermentans]RBP11360.1 amino acid/amide ABC transporter ATP-binding protein 1 (HAAT family) [Roseiarcus fermentans]
MSELNTEAISVQFQGLRALDSVDLSLKEGEILGLLGPNGAGKTTLVNVISGFQRPTEGTVRVDGKSVGGLTPDALARCGVARTFQSVRLFRRLSVLENVEISALCHAKSRNEARSTARRALEFVGLGPVARRLAGELPYADERRVGIARALALRPRFLLLDEPAAGMTDSECRDLVEIVRQLPQSFGCAVLLIEHNIGLVMEVCNRLHVLNGGRTLADGPVETVRNNPDVIAAYLGGA